MHASLEMINSTFVNGHPIYHKTVRRVHLGKSHVRDEGIPNIQESVILTKKKIVMATDYDIQQQQECTFNQYKFQSNKE